MRIYYISEIFSVCLETTLFISIDVRERKRERERERERKREREREKEREREREREKESSKAAGTQSCPRLTSLGGFAAYAIQRIGGMPLWEGMMESRLSLSLS